MTKPKEKISYRRAITPVVAVLLLIAIAITGGTMVFAVSGNYNTLLNESGTPQVVSLEITGFDSRDVSILKLHDGVHNNNSVNPGDFDGQQKNGLVKGERIAVYLQNDSISPVYLSEVWFGGEKYFYVPGGSLEAYNTNFMNPGEYAIVTKSTDDVAELLFYGTPKLQPGQEVTLLFELAGNKPLTRDSQIKITTNTGASFIGTIYLGEYFKSF